MNYDVVIIGGGPAGLTCALYTARAGLKTLVIEQMFYGGQAAITVGIENYPGFAEPIDGAALGAAMKAQAENAGAEFVTGTVNKIDATAKNVITLKDVYGYKALVICTGADHRRLGVEGEEMLTGSGVSYCATCDGGFFKGKVVAVAGGGNTAFEDALYLSKICEKVHIIHRRSEFRASAALVKRATEVPNIEIITDSVTEEFEKDGFKLSGIVIKNVKSGEKRTVKVDGLFVAVGMIPRSGLVDGVVKLDKSGYIEVDKNMRTSAEGVFAAGDVTDTTLRQIVTAAADGAKAAAAAEKYIEGAN